MTLQEITNFKKELREQIQDDLAATLLSLTERLPDTGDRYSEAVKLRSRLNAANKERRGGLLSAEEYRLEIDRIRSSTLELINELGEADFQVKSTGKRAGDGPAQGSVLYRVPGRMSIGKSTYCKIRVAIDEEELYNDIEVDENVHVRNRVEVSDMMSAELIDPGNGVFTIRSLSTQEQLIRAQGYTEWIFTVTPNIPGRHELLVRVSMLEYVEKLKKFIPKEISILETVTIVASEADMDALEEVPFKNTGETLQIEPGSRKKSAKKSTPDTSEPARQPGKSGRSRIAALLLILLMASTTTTWAFTTPAQRDWWLASVLDRPDKYGEFVNKYEKDPDAAEYVQKARYFKAKKTDALVDWRAYQNAYADAGRYARDVSEQIRRIESRRLVNLLQQPDAGALRAFVADFPDSDQFPKIAEALTGKITPADERYALLENALIGSIRQKPDTTTIRVFLRDFRESARREEVAAIVKGNPAIPESIQTALPEEENPQRLVPATVRVKGGTFTMGCQDGRDKDCFDSEKPAHTVQVRTFEISKYEITNEEYAAFLNVKGNREEGGVEWINLGGSFLGEHCRIRQEKGIFVVEKGWGKHPVSFVSWYGARACCGWLSEETGKTWRLPTEAEWEYAARGGSKSKGYQYAGGNSLDEVGWYTENTSDSGTKETGGKKPNELGIYDMSGNVYEWCSDWYGDYSGDRQTDPEGPGDGSYRVLRGGCWFDFAIYCRSADRFDHTPDYRLIILGFRPVVFVP